MVSESESTSIRRFVCGQLRDEPDLSTLTLGILKKRYLAHVGREALDPKARTYMKQVIQEELIKMQKDSDESGSELNTKKPQNKRKREKENDEVISDIEDESRAKKSRRQTSSLSSESEDKEDCKTASEESEDEDAVESGSEDREQDVKKSPPKTNGNHKRHVTSQDSTDEEKNESEQKGNESNCGDSPKEMIRKLGATKNGQTRGSDTIQETETPQSDEEKGTDTDNKSDNTDSNESSDDGKKENEEEEKKKNDEPDSDSSSLPSLEDEPKSEDKNKLDNKKKKTIKNDESSRSQKDDDKAIVRLKRYISLCGVRHNYKKLLDGCRSVRSKVAVLKKELECLGVHGKPSIEKCKKVRMKREEAKELAELDVNNIIATQGRPKRRGASAWQEKQDPPSSTYQRTLNSGSDSDEENNTSRGGRRTTDWANLQGIISDDADSD